MIDDDRIVILEITSWRGGFAVGAMHYYGTLKGCVSGEIRCVEIEHAMTEDEARALNLKDGWDGYRAGDTTSRFDTEDAVIKMAKAIYKTHFPHARALAVGQFAAAGPKRVVDCDSPEFRDQANCLYARAEALGWWDDPENDDTMDALAAAWDALVAGLETSPQSGQEMGDV